MDQDTDEQFMSTQFNSAAVKGYLHKTAPKSNGMICLLCGSGVCFTLPVNLSARSAMKTTKLR